MLLQSAKDGCDEALQQLLALHRTRLKRMVGMRMHPLLRSRVDESDIVQEALWDASQRIDDYFEKSSMPFFLWLRFIAAQKLLQCQRHHLDVQKRSLKHHDAGINFDDSVSINLVNHIVSRECSPSSKAVMNEVAAQVRQVLDSMPASDREILCMRHYEQLTNAEVAESLEITPSNASTRYFRALAKLQVGLKSISGWKSGP